MFVEGNALQVTFPSWLLCSYEWFLCGLRAEGNSASSGCTQAASASLCHPRERYGKYCSFLEHHSASVRNWGSHADISFVISFSILLKKYWLGPHSSTASWKRCEKEPVFTLNNHENGVTERTDGSTRQLTFGAKPDSILLDSSSSGTASKCFLFQN